MLQEAERHPPHKIDENMWKNREQIEEILFLLDVSRWPTSVRYTTCLFHLIYIDFYRPHSLDNQSVAFICFTQLRQESVVEGVELVAVVMRLQEKFKSTLKTMENFQARNSEFVFDTGSILSFSES